MGFNNQTPMLIQTGITSASFESLPPYERGWATSGSIEITLNNWGNTDNTLTVDVYWGIVTKGLVPINANINWKKDASLTTTYTGSGGTSVLVPDVINLPAIRSKYIKLVFTLAGTTKSVDVTAFFFGKSDGSAPGIATAANQTNGLQLMQITDAGGDVATITGGKLDVNATASLAGSAIPISGATTAVGVGILDGSGNQITSFGGGTQYTEGVTTLPATGTVALSRVVSDFTTYSEDSLNIPISDVYGRLTVNVGQSLLDNFANAYATDTANVPTPTAGGIMTLGSDTGTARYFKLDSSGAVFITSSSPLDVSANITQDSVGLALENGGNLAVTATSVASIDTKTPALGQALAAASVPVVLTASQLSTITPPAAITGFATSAKQDTLLTELQLKADLTETQPVSLASVPSHAVTNAGTFAVQAAGTKTNNNAAPTTDNVGVLPALVNASSPSFTEGNQTLLSINTTGNLRTTVNQVAGNAIATGNGASSTGVLRVAQVNDGTGIIATVSTVTNLAQMNGAAITMGNGASGTGVQRVTIANDSTGVIATVSAVTAITNALPAGTNNIGQVSVAPQTANGLSVFNATSSDGATALTSTAQAIKASAGQLYGWYIYNPNATAQFVQLYNVAQASVTVGTTNPLFMLTIPATSGANVEFTNGITFSNAGWSCAATSTAGGAGAPGTALDAVFFFK